MIFDKLFQLMAEKKASDIFVSAGAPIHIKIQGSTIPINQQIMDPETIQRMAYEMLTAEQIRHFETEKEINVSFGIRDIGNFRVNMFWQRGTIAIVVRFIQGEIPKMDELGLPDTLAEIIMEKRGLVLVVGSTGSGKSTTLAAMIDHLNGTRRGHILTIEDPVEFVHAAKSCLVTHKEVGEHVPSFLEAIRSAGRENADVILVGELRGAETMKLALQLASFGILIFATVHTNSAAATIDRFVNAFPAEQQPQIRGLLADSLAGVVAQQLLKRADGSGRVAVHEILVGNLALSSLIREGKTSQIASFIQAGAAEGMQTMDSALERLVREGAVRAADALEKAIDKESFAKLPHIARELSPDSATLGTPV